MKTDSTKTVVATRFRRKPLITALEPRLLLDGAAVVTAVDMSTDVAHQEQAIGAEAAVAPVELAAAPVAPVAPAGTVSGVSESSPDPESVSESDASMVDPAAVQDEALATGNSAPEDMPAAEAISIDGAAVDSSESATANANTDEIIDDTADSTALDEAIAPTATRREVAFVDTQAEDYQVLVDGLDEGVEVHLIDGDSSGLDQMAQALEGQSGIDAIHVYSHGEQGTLNLGSLTLNSGNVREFGDVLTQIGASLSAEGDLMLYGCYVGADNAGQDFVDALAELTGADVAASDDATGASDRGGDWNLEVSVGAIETTALAQAQYDGLLAVPSVTQFSDFTYTEDSGVVFVDQNVVITGSGNFFGGYVEFSLAGSTTYETLGIARVGSPATGNGAISVVGSVVYRGDGTAATVIGNVDSVYNGLNGENLRFNLLNSFQNGAFQTGSNGDTVIVGWTAQTGRIRLDGSYQIAGQATPIDSTYSSGNTSGDFSSGGSFTQSTNLSDYAAAYSGDLSLLMDTGADSIDQRYGVIRGPAVYSNAAVSLEAGDQVSFQWMARSGGDAYDAYGYLVDVDNGRTITILDSTGSAANQETAWATRTVNIGAGQAGNYRFVFVAGSFDFTGGQYLGGALMIDDVTVTQANPPMLSGADVANLSRLVTYSNADQDFAAGTRTVTLTAKDVTGDAAGSGSATITLARSNDAPSFTSGATLGAVAEDTVNPAGSTVTTLLSGRFSDPDAANTPADTLAGVAVVADTSNSAQGVWEYSTTNGTDWHAIGAVSNTNALVLSASSLIRFRPSTDWNGTPGSLSVHAVDSTYASPYTAGSVRATYDTTSDGQTSPVSASAVTLGTSVTAVNDAPVAGDDASSAVEAGGVANAVPGSGSTGNVLGNDTDVDTGDTRSVSAVRSGAEAGTGTAGTLGVALAGSYGSLTLNANGSYTYVVNENNAAVQALRISGQSVTDSFTYTVRDAGGLTDQATVSITIDGRNDNPVGNDDTATAVEAGGVFNATTGSDATGNVLSNDTDVDSTANGETQTVTTVRTGAETGSGTSGTVGQALTGTYGTLTLNDDGSYSYAIDESNAAVQALRISGQTVNESFTYTVTDAGGLTDQAMLTITIDGRNDNPVAAIDDIAMSVEAGGLFNGAAGSNGTGNVLTNDSDVDSGDTRTVSAIRTGVEAGTGSAGTVGNALAGSYGSLTLNGDGSYTYVIDESNASVQALRISGQTLTDSFTYTVSDTGGLTDQATVSVTIDGRNDNPVGIDDTGMAVESGGVFNGTAGANATGNVLTNDTDVDSIANGETQTVTTVRTGTEADSGTAGTVGQALTGTYGNLTLNSDGSYTYVIDESNAAVQALRISGQTINESFTYTVTDTGGLTDQAMLTITIDGRNDNPVAVDDGAMALEASNRFNAVAGADASGNVLTNDTDVDSDGNGESQVVSGVRTGAESGAGSVGSVGQTLAGTYGSLTLNGDGSYTYTIDDTHPSVQALRISGQNLTDSFTYTVRDTGGLTDQATLTITIDGRNDNPVGIDDTGTAVEAGGVFNSRGGSNAVGNVLTNDTDVDSAAGGETRTVTALRAGPETSSGSSGNVGQAFKGTYGSLTLRADGSYTYVVDDNNATVQALRTAGQTLSESFVYTVTDAGGLTDEAMLTITVQGQNDAPVVTGSDIPDQEWAFGKPFSLDVSTPFSDVDGKNNGEDLSFTIAGLPAGLTYNAATGVISGSPSGIGSFVVRITASDRDGSSISREFTFEVLPPPTPETPQAPVAQPFVAPPPSLPVSPSVTVQPPGQTLSLPTGTVGGTGPSGSTALDPGYLTGSGLFDGAGSGGASGSAGAGGDSGAIGAGGADGAAGSAGTGGDSGANGAAGADGAAGSAGAGGDSGAIGASGADGGAGSAGVGGDSGGNGAGGADGAAGSAGVGGADGTEGATSESDGSGSAASSSQGKEGGSGKGGGSERVLIEEGTTRASEMVNPEGKVTSVSASVQVNVGPDGVVVFTDTEKEAFEIVGMSVTEIRAKDSGLEVGIADQVAGRDTQYYTGELGNGDQLPSWIRVDAKTGELTISNPPKGTEALAVRIKAIGSDGKVRMLELSLDFDELLKRKAVEPTQSDAQADGKPVAAFAPLNAQVAEAIASSEGYGQRLAALLEST